MTGITETWIALQQISTPTGSLWTALGAIWSIIAWWAATFYFIRTIKLVHATRDSITLSQTQLDILSQQITQQKEERKNNDQRYRYEMISEFETWDKPSRMKMKRKSDNISWFISIYTYTKLQYKLWRWSFTPDIAPELKEEHNSTKESKWEIIQEIKKMYYYTYRWEPMNDDWSLH